MSKTKLQLEPSIFFVVLLLIFVNVTVFPFVIGAVWLSVACLLTESTWCYRSRVS